MKTQSSKLIFAGAICLASASLFAGCGKSGKQSAEQQAIARHEQDVGRQRVQWQEYQRFKNLPIEKWPAGPSTMDAAQFLIELLKSGRLPDVEDAKHNLLFNIDPFATNYPMSRTFNLQMKSSPFANHYTLIKTSATESWQLQRAWRTDAQGNVVKTYPVDKSN